MANDPVTERFLAEVQRAGGSPRGIGPADATTAVLCPFLLTITLGEVRDVLAVLPPTLRSLLEECVRRSDGRPARFDAEQFFRMVRYRLPDITVEDADDIVRAVFAALQPLLPERIQRGIASQLPRDLKRLWMPGRRAA
jgi:uncharacterized protein (DUF2267 family)